MLLVIGAWNYYWPVVHVYMYTVMGCLHDPAAIQQFMCILNTFAGSLLDVCCVNTIIEARGTS